MNPDLATLIRVRMAALSILSYTELARRVGLSSQHVCNMMKGRSFYAEARKKVGVELGIPEDVMLEKASVPELTVA